MDDKSERYSAKFKAAVVLEAMKASDTDSSIARAYGIHPVTLSRWKQQLQREAAAIFGESEALRNLQKRVAELEGMIAEIEIEKRILRDIFEDVISVDEKIELVEKYKDEFGLNRICELVHLPKSTYYYRLDHSDS